MFYQCPLFIDLQWLQFIFYFLCFFTDIMPRSYFKIKFQQACDLMFTTAAVPMSFVSVANSASLM